MSNVISFPKTAKTQEAKKSAIKMTLKREQNGMTVVTNLKNLTNEEFLQTLISDAIMTEKLALVKKYINS